jgi:hypothetical protein
MGLNRGRVEGWLTPTLPHQTVHAIFPHTAFRCSSHQGMHIAPSMFVNATEDIAPAHSTIGHVTIDGFLLGLDI